jgi:cyclohex-1-ene-1-carboxyl-CoA hydratase
LQRVPTSSHGRLVVHGRLPERVHHPQLGNHPQVRKPVLAAVAGYAMGGGCELALACDIVVAAESARFALPEVKLAMLPGAGGTQRLPRAIGKAKAMDMCLSARMLNAEEADRYGLVSRVVPDAELLDRPWPWLPQVSRASRCPP